MKSTPRIMPWKLNVVLSTIVLLVLFFFSFYGIYSNRFYFFKPDNYIFPVLTIVHFVFLYVFWSKMKYHEDTDRIMRNLEFGLYFICLVYVFKIFDTAHTLLEYNTLWIEALPSTFLPIGFTMLSLYCLIVILTIVTFFQRKKHIGSYTFEEVHTGFDTW